MKNTKKETYDLIEKCNRDILQNKNIDFINNKINYYINLKFKEKCDIILLNSILDRHVNMIDFYYLKQKFKFVTNIVFFVLFIYILKEYLMIESNEIYFITLGPLFSFSRIFKETKYKISVESKSVELIKNSIDRLQKSP
jgi:hypothetical protein